MVKLSRFEKAKGISMKLHLGCGTRHFPGYINIDQVDGYNVDLVCDISKLPYEDNSVDVIYACHVLEYFDWQEAESIVLPEWYRVLKPGGTIRIAVPYFDSIVRWYIDKGRCDLSECIGLLFGRQYYNNKYQYHKCVYDHDTLYILLLNVGFGSIHCYNWENTEHSHIDDCSQAYLPHMDKKNGLLMSLNIEAYK